MKKRFLNPRARGLAHRRNQAYKGIMRVHDFPSRSIEQIREEISKLVDQIHHAEDNGMSLEEIDRLDSVMEDLEREYEARILLGEDTSVYIEEA